MSATVSPHEQVVQPTFPIVPPPPIAPGKSRAPRSLPTTDTVVHPMPEKKRQKFLPFALPDIGNAELLQVRDVLKSGWITTGPKVHQFEAEFAAAVGAKYALAVNSCTAAMHLALDAIGLEAGDIVLTTPFTFAATAEVVRYFHATPVLVDVEPDTLNIDPLRLAQTLDELQRNPTAYHGGPNANSRHAFDGIHDRRRRGTRPPVVKAVLPVHFAGLPADLDAIYAIATKHKLAVIEDAAHAFPAHYRGRKIGQNWDGRSVGRAPFHLLFLLCHQDDYDWGRRHDLHGK